MLVITLTGITCVRNRLWHRKLDYFRIQNKNPKKDVTFIIVLFYTLFSEVHKLSQNHMIHLLKIFFILAELQSGIVRFEIKEVKAKTESNYKMKIPFLDLSSNMYMFVHLYVSTRTAWTKVFEI